MSMNVTQFVGSDNFNMARFNAMIQQINSGVNSEVSALTNLINSGAKIQTGSYVGTGTYGSSNPCTLTFDFVPKLVVIGCGNNYDSSTYMVYSGNNIFAAPNFQGMRVNETLSRDDHLYTLTYRIGDSVATWWSVQNADIQFNYIGTTYYYVCIG